MCCSVLQCVAGVLHCVAVCCSVLQCVCCSALLSFLSCMPWFVAGVLQLRCVLQCVTACCSVLQCDAVQCSVLQCVAGLTIV